MPQNQVATNPLGANRRSRISSFSSWLDEDSQFLEDMYPTEVWNLYVSTAVTKYNLVSLVTPSTTVPLSIKPTVTGDAIGVVFGIALDTAAAGQVARVCVGGFTYAALESAQTTALGTYIVRGATTTGRVQVEAAVDATDIVDVLLGKALGVKCTVNSIDYAPMCLFRRW